ncbi:oxidoreductase [Hyphodiscus hymeniophilus]|uniref:Oxidoreductase n=1 Tax=Hyphodiscus hymeniophilus TaxID=353542 RepID=A0A9P6SKF5_9HELO|nr:oxidoreductase [Hyphodiscus hymeniophilus]
MNTTVILGTGIIGVSTAYYLSQAQPPSSIHLVEPSPVLFASASGFAAGFLAKDWFSPSVAAVGALSFEEHSRLAEEFDGREKWGYMKSSGVSYTAGRRDGETKARGDDWLRGGGSRADGLEVSNVSSEGYVPRWLRRSEGDVVESISEEGSTAQINPLRLCQFLSKTCVDRGVQLHHPAKAISVHSDNRNELSSIRILNTDTQTETDVPCTKILIAAGAWSSRVFETLFPNSDMKLPISSLAGHSLVVRSPRWSKEHEGKGCHAVFTAGEDGYSPEIFSRIGGEIYVAGLNDASLALPSLPTESKIEEKSIKILKETAKQLLGEKEDLDDLEVLKTGLCFRPVTHKGTPILVKLPEKSLGSIETRGGDEGGVWLAAGHGPWGISLSLGSGKVMAEMIQGRPPSVNVTELGL